MRFVSWIQVKHVCVVAVVFAAVGFGYVIGFAEIDAVRSPRAGAIGARASFSRLVGNVRMGMASGQERRSRVAADEMVALYPENPQSWLYRGMVYRFAFGGAEGADWWDGSGEMAGDAGVVSKQEGKARSWERLLEIVGGEDFDSLGGRGLSESLYHRGWAKRGLGRVEDSRADFVRLARLTEEGIGVDSDGPVIGGVFGGVFGGVGEGSIGVGAAYNLACYWALAGRLERALDYWRVCVEGGYDLNGAGGWWRVDPDLEDLWDDERFWGIAGE